MEQNDTTDNSSPFEILASFPFRLSQSQCVVYNNEILVCGGYQNNNCYSYHTQKNQYKFICPYPKDITLDGHSVVKRVDNENPNNITLLSFGGLYKHTLIMKYTSVWNEKGDESENAKTKPLNRWVPLTNSQNNLICIGTNGGDYEGVRAVIGGNANHLLFITYSPKNIDVFNLATCRYVNRCHLPIDDSFNINFHCFVSRTQNGLAMTKANENKKHIEMLLFCKNIGLSIKYDEDKAAFQFEKLLVCTTIRPLNYYAYVCIDNIILLFGGCNDNLWVPSKDVYKYAIDQKQWKKFEYTLPVPLFGCAGILNTDDTSVHILGGRDDKGNRISTHIKTNVNEWTKEETEKEKQWLREEEQKIEIEEIKTELENVKQDFDIKRLK
ncbi:hypothetical protein RFI_15021, partial [Reticulomyxa filosa]